jgi:hypothetical protein
MYLMMIVQLVRDMFWNGAINFVAPYIFYYNSNNDMSFYPGSHRGPKNGHFVGHHQVAVIYACQS